MRLLALSAVVAVAFSTCGPADDGLGQFTWDVQRSNGANATLFGAVHSLGVDAMREEYPSAIDSFLSSSVLVVETDTSNIDVAEYASRALLSEGEPSLDSLLTSDEWKELVLELPDVPESTLRRARPWYVLQLVVAKQIAGTRGENALPMDAELVVDAKARGVEVVFLEPWQEQIDAIAAATDLDALKAALALGLNKVQFQTTELEVDWRSGDAERIGERLDAQTATQNEILLYARNERWRVALEQLLEKDKREVFVAVGAAHLVHGEKRLPELLRKSGLGVSRRPLNR